MRGAVSGRGNVFDESVREGVSTLAGWYCTSLKVSAVAAHTRERGHNARHNNARKYRRELY